MRKRPHLVNNNVSIRLGAAKELGFPGSVFIRVTEDLEEDGVFNCRRAPLWQYLKPADAVKLGTDLIDAAMQALEDGKRKPRKKKKHT